MEKLVNEDYIGVVRVVDGKFHFEMVDIKIQEEQIAKLTDIVANQNKSILDMYEHFQIAYPPRTSPPHICCCLPFEYASSYVGGVSYPTMEDPKKYLELITKNEIGSMKKAQDKKDALNVFTRYIQCNCFNNTLKQIKRDPTIKMFSSELTGWETFEAKLNNDITITLRTNFGYGSSSYFLVNLRYKDVDLLPYSDYVRYYRAKIVDLVRYTRQYYPERSRWDNALNFVVNMANLAIENPVAFEKQWVYNEVQEMLSGLRRINNYPKAAIEEAMKTSNKDRYTTVSDITDYERKQYKIYPSESTIAFKAEKITGALKLLYNLEKLESLRSDINVAIEEIKDINLKLLPEIKTNITSIENDIAPMQSEYDIVDSKLERIKKIVDNHTEFMQKQRLSPQEYFDNIPRFRKLNSMKDGLNKKYWDLYYKIRERKEFVERLNKCVKIANDKGIN